MYKITKLYNYIHCYNTIYIVTHFCIVARLDMAKHK